MERTTRRRITSGPRTSVLRCLAAGMLLAPVGCDFMGPGQEATFSGTVYLDGEPTPDFVVRAVGARYDFDSEPVHWGGVSSGPDGTYVLQLSHCELVTQIIAGLRSELDVTVTPVPPLPPDGLDSCASRAGLDFYFVTSP